jgi:hypothetical protein
MSGVGSSADPSRLTRQSFSAQSLKVCADLLLFDFIYAHDWSGVFMLLEQLHCFKFWIAHLNSRFEVLDEQCVIRSPSFIKPCGVLPTGGQIDVVWNFGWLTAHVCSIVNGIAD